MPREVIIIRHTDLVTGQIIMVILVTVGVEAVMAGVVIMDGVLADTAGAVIIMVGVVVDTAGADTMVGNGVNLFTEMV
jgi:hypothetical protein